MGKPKPIITKIDNRNKPVIDNAPPKNEWLFSFKDFQQIDNFGFKNTDASWFASLFSRLMELSKINLELLQKNAILKDDLRYHVINWAAKNIPISRDKFYWVSEDIINNEVEFPFFQFQISKALGRVIGYWSENVFYVLLLDPMHNMQPSKYNNYKIRQSSPVSTDISNLLFEIEQLRKHECSNPVCKIKKEIMMLTYTKKDSNAVVCFLDNDYLSELDNLCERISLTDIVEAGITYLV